MFDLEDGVVSEIGCQQVNNNIKSIEPFAKVLPFFSN